MTTPTETQEDAIERGQELPPKIAETLNFIKDRYDIKPKTHEYIRPPSREGSLPDLSQVLNQLQGLKWTSDQNSDEGFSAVEPYKAVHGMQIVDERKPDTYGRLWVRYGLAGAKDYDSLPENQILSLEMHVTTRGQEPLAIAQESQTPPGSIYVRFTDGNAVHYSLKKLKKPDLVTQVTGGRDVLGMAPGVSPADLATGGGEPF